MTFDPERFGQILQVLRGKSSQKVVERKSGVPQHRISAFERGEVQDPGFITLNQLTKYYGLNPNETAAAAGIFALADAEQDQFAPDIAGTLEAIRNFMLELEALPRQRRFSQMLKDTMDQMRDAIDEDEALESSQLPEYIRNKIKRISG